MAIINSTKFGNIVVDNKNYDKDIKILPSGKILNRWGPKGSHLICLEELNEILDDKPDVIVIGTGQEKIAKLEPDAKKKIQEKNIKLIIEPTPQAIISFNDLNEKKAGLFHLTC